MDGLGSLELENEEDDDVRLCMSLLLTTIPHVSHFNRVSLVTLNSPVSAPILGTLGFA